MSDRPWLRQVEVTVGAIPDWKVDTTFNGPPAPVALRVYSDGTQNHLRVKFSVHKHIISTPTPTLIHIYNLSPNLRSALLLASGTKEMRGAQVVLKVGWMNGDSGGLGTKLQPIFIGGLWASWTRREGADLVTTLSCVAGLPAYRGTIQKTVLPNTSLYDLILELARKIPGITVDPKLIDIPIPVSVGKRGMSLSGLIVNCLDDLSRVYGFSWHIIDGVFEAAMDGEKQAFMGTVVKLSAANGFLLRAEPMLATPWQQQIGISIHSLLHPLIQPGRVVELTTYMNPSLSGSYLAQTVSHHGDTFSNQWDTEIESFLINKSPAKPGVKAIDNAGLNFIAKQEGNVLTKHYVDGIAHIGVGHRLTPLELQTNKVKINGVQVDITHGLTPQQSLDLQKQDLVWVQSTINNVVAAPLTQNQFNALASITYNCGNLGSLPSVINTGDYAQVGKLILDFKTTSQGTGQVSKVLIKRRKDEAALWNS